MISIAGSDFWLSEDFKVCFKIWFFTRYKLLILRKYMPSFCHQLMVKKYLVVEKFFYLEIIDSVRLVLIEVVRTLLGKNVSFNFLSVLQLTVFVTPDSISSTKHSSEALWFWWTTRFWNIWFCYLGWKLHSPRRYCYWWYLIFLNPNVYTITSCVLATKMPVKLFNFWSVLARKKSQHRFCI